MGVRGQYKQTIKIRVVLGNNYTFLSLWLLQLRKVDLRSQDGFLSVLILFDSTIYVSLGYVLLILPKVDFMPGGKYGEQKQSVTSFIYFI